MKTTLGTVKCLTASVGVGLIWVIYPREDLFAYGGMPGHLQQPCYLPTINISLCKWEKMKLVVLIFTFSPVPHCLFFLLGRRWRQTNNRQELKYGFLSIKLKYGFLSIIKNVVQFPNMFYK